MRQDHGETGKDKSDEGSSRLNEGEELGKERATIHFGACDPEAARILSAALSRPVVEVVPAPRRRRLGVSSRRGRKGRSGK